MEVKGSFFITTGLPILIALIMFGLGLTLKKQDFLRVLKMPGAPLMGLVIKIILLPAIAYVLCLAFGLIPTFAVGTMMVAAAPSSAMANVFSRLGKGDVALSLCLTAIDNILTAVTLPLFVALSFHLFMGESQQIGLQWQESLKIFVLILVPTLLGMAFVNKWPSAAVKVDKVLRIISMLVLVVLLVGVFSANKHLIAEYAGQLAVVITLFNLICYALGYLIPRLLKLGKPQSISLAMAMGLQGTALIATIAISILQNVEFAMPAAFFSLSMYLLGFATLALLRKKA